MIPSLEDESRINSRFLDLSSGNDGIVMVIYRKGEEGLCYVFTRRE